MENKKKKRFRLFDITRDGKGISKKQADMKPGLKKFFITFKNNFNKLITVNIIMVLGNFPAIFLIMVLSGITKSDVYYPLSDTFQNLNGVIQSDGGITPYTMSLYAIEGLQNQDLAPTVWTYVFYGLGALTAFTFGPINASTAYILRNIVSGEPVFVWADFKYALRRNIKQSLPFGIIDLALCGILCFNIYSMFNNGGNILTDVFFWTNIIILILYFFMRYYVYIQMVTFNLSVFKIIKNSLIFALLGIKRNIMALLGILLLLALEIFFLVGTGGVLVPLAVAAPLVLLFSLFSYMKVYAAYFKIKDVMIDPYYEQHPELRPKQPEDDEVIMTDDVSEAERLEEIKHRNSIQ